MMWPLLSSEVSSIRYMFASGISSRTRRQMSAPSTLGIIQSRIASVGGGFDALPSASRCRRASAPSDTDRDVELPLAKRLRQHRGGNAIVVGD